MDLFIKRIGLFFIILLIINYCLFELGQVSYFSDYEKVSLDYTKYLFADSHGLPLADGTQQYGVYNFSAGSDSYYDIKRKVLYLINETHIDTIYLTVDDHTLSPYRDKMNNLDRSITFLTINGTSGWYEYVKLKFIKRYVTFFQPKTGQVIKAFCLEKIKNVFMSPASKTKPNWSDYSDKDRVLKSLNRFHSQFPEKNKSANLTEELINIIKICKESEIVLVGVKFPLSKDYVDAVGEMNYGADSIFISNGLTVLDFKKEYIKSNDYFKNQDHLNAIGGHQFVDILFETKKN